MNFIARRRIAAAFRRENETHRDELAIIEAWGAGRVPAETVKWANERRLRIWAETDALVSRYQR